MDAHAVSLLAVFEKKVCLEVPLFQRQYVWTREHQWEPLWEDISRKFIESLEGRRDAPVHFLGALVLDQKQTPITHVEKRQVIDGQQRLTTLQIFISAFRDFCREYQCTELAKECESFTENKGMMANRQVDQFKVWPTLVDRKQFMDVVTSGSRIEVERRNQVVWKKYARKPDPRPRMVEAYLYFYDQLVAFFVGSDAEASLFSGTPISDRLEECFQALKNSLMVVTIDLQQGDDAQVIFETLNARGEPLLPADLLRNYIFLRAARAGDDQEALYKRYWEQFDDQFWRIEIKQGRLNRPRSDLFMQHFLSGQIEADIPVKHLFVEYRNWIERRKPYQSVEHELQNLSINGQNFRRILEPKSEDVVYGASEILDVFDIRTAYPLLLLLLESEISQREWADITLILGSYLVRRSICGLTTKNYNRVFLQLTKSLRRNGVTATRLAQQLSSQTGDSAKWPSDEEFKDAWMNTSAYSLGSAKVVYILSRINESYISIKGERIYIPRDHLCVEHIMPQSWISTWPLADGSRGMGIRELFDAPDGDQRALATKIRSGRVQTFGNLTILSRALNAVQSNGPWEEKRLQLMTHSLLPINQNLAMIEKWDETAIANRSLEMFLRAVAIWPNYESFLLNSLG